MSENLPTNVQLDANQNGTVSFATDVVATIAGLAATEVEGVANMAGNTGFADHLFSRRATAGKNLTKGVRVDVNDGKVIVDVTFVVEYGSPVPEVAKAIQENVKKAIETMSGLTVEAVDVHVSGVSFEKENKAVAEIEQQQKFLLQKQAEGERDQQLKNDPVEQLSKDESAANTASEEENADEDDFVMELPEDDYEEPAEEENDAPQEEPGVAEEE